MCVISMNYIYLSHLSENYLFVISAESIKRDERDSGNLSDSEKLFNRSLNIRIQSTENTKRIEKISETKISK